MSAINKKTPHPIYVIGSINTDMVVKTDSLPQPGQTVLGGEFIMTAGGKGANQAVAASRLGGNVSMVGCVGLDVFGDEALTKLKSEKISCDFVSRDQATPSGVALISVDGAGENHIVVAPGANNCLEEQSVAAALIAAPPTSMILAQLETPLATVAHTLLLAKEKGCKVVLDPAPAQELPQKFFQDLYLITPNETEAEILTGIKVDGEETALAAAKVLLARGALNVAITMGKNGVLLANTSKSEIFLAPQTSALDTTAAGDCFNGAVAAALAQGNTLAYAVDFGCQCASISVTRMGAQESLPTLNEVSP